MFIVRFAAKAGFLTFIFGIVSLVTAITQRKLETLSIEAIATKKPDSKWVRIEGGVFDLTNASSISFRGLGSPLKLYVPLVKPDYDASENLIHVLVVTEDPATLKLYKGLKDASEAGFAEGLEFALKHAEYLEVSRPVQGLVHSGFDESGSQERKILKGYEGDIAKDAIIIEEGNEPSFSGAISMMAGGLALCVVCGALSNAFAKKTPVPPPLPPTIPPPLPRPN
jgi:hypothetical protein